MSTSAKEKVKKARGFERMCLAIERVGHKIPDPTTIFLILTAIIFIVSLFIEGKVLLVPGTGEEVTLHSLLNADFTKDFIKNIPSKFVTYTPVPYVLILLLGTSVCSETGLFEVSMKRALSKVPDSLVVLILIALSINGSLVGDGAYAFLPALGGIIYHSKGKNPLLGIVTVYACIAAGFSACMLITNGDVQVAGLTAEAAGLLHLDTSNITGASTYYWQAISAIFLIPVAWFASEKIVSPILKSTEYALDDDADNSRTAEDLTALTPDQQKGLRYAGISAILVILFVLIGAVPSHGFLRNQETGSLLIGSPFMSDLVMLIVALFFIPGLTYGIASKAIRSDKDLTRMISRGFSSMSPFLVMCFGASIFNTCFSYTNVASAIAIGGANLMESIHLTGLFLVLFIVLLCALCNLFMPHTTAKWILLAPVMVPMCALLGFSPNFTTALYKIGNSVTNCITPLSSGMVIALGEMQKYRKKTSLGSIISLNIPFSVMFLIFWTLMTIVFYLVGLPVGPNAPIFMS